MEKPPPKVFKMEMPICDGISIKKKKPTRSNKPLAHLLCLQKLQELVSEAIDSHNENAPDAEAIKIKEFNPTNSNAISNDRSHSTLSEIVSDVIDSSKQNAESGSLVTSDQLLTSDLLGSSGTLINFNKEEDLTLRNIEVFLEKGCQESSDEFGESDNVNVTSERKNNNLSSGRRLIQLCTDLYQNSEGLSSLPGRKNIVTVVKHELEDQEQDSLSSSDVCLESEDNSLVSNLNLAGSPSTSQESRNSTYKDIDLEKASISPRSDNLHIPTERNSRNTVLALPLEGSLLNQSKKRKDMDNFLKCMQSSSDESSETQRSHFPRKRRRRKYLRQLFSSGNEESSDDELFEPPIELVTLSDRKEEEQTIKHPLRALSESDSNDGLSLSSDYFLDELLDFSETEETRYINMLLNPTLLETSDDESVSLSIITKTDSETSSTLSENEVESSIFSDSDSTTTSESDVLTCPLDSDYSTSSSSLTEALPRIPEFLSLLYEFSPIQYVEDSTDDERPRFDVESVLTENTINSQCSICLTEGKLWSLPCLHTFHKDCIKSWFQSKSNCPVCRTDY